MKCFSVFFLLFIFYSTSAFSSPKYIVKLKKGFRSAFNLKEASRSYGDFKPLSLEFGDFYVLTKNRNADMKKLSENPAVEYVEVNQTYTINSDPYYKKQWGLKNTGDNSGGWFNPGVAGEDVNAEKAWEITKGSKDVIIAVIDTGIDHKHPDLKANMLVNELELNGEAGVDDDGNGYVDDVYGYDFANKDGDPIDDHGHGTHCAGIIGAIHNSTGVRGVMANVKFVGLKFLTASGSGETDGAIQSINYAIKAGVHIMSNSWGGGESSEALKDAIKAAEENGIIFVAASGNSSQNIDLKPAYPASYDLDAVVTVGAHDGRGNRSSFSNYGEKSVDIYAPGSNIYSTFVNGSYKSLSGTSMAAPFVSGVLGLLLANEPGISVNEAKERLIKTAISKISLKASVAGGRTDAYRVLENIQN